MTEMRVTQVVFVGDSILVKTSMAGFLLLLCSSSRWSHWHVNLLISRNILQVKRLMPRDETKSIEGKGFCSSLCIAKTESSMDRFGTVSVLVKYVLVWSTVG